MRHRNSGMVPGWEQVTVTPPDNHKVSNALTRPSRPMDLAKLDISACSFSASDVVLKALHLSKQIKPSISLADFSYPNYPGYPNMCTVVTLQEYQSRTLKLWALDSVNPKRALFLSWIRKHGFVSSSTIARWLKICLQQVGIDTGVLKAHSVRGAASSKAVWSGVTISDILQAADWSSEVLSRDFVIIQLMKIIE